MNTFESMRNSETKVEAWVKKTNSEWESLNVTMTDKIHKF